MRKVLGHKLPPILLTPAKKIQRDFHFLVFETRTRVEGSLQVRYTYESDNWLLFISKLWSLRISELPVLHRPTPLKSCNGESCSGCGGDNLHDAA